MEDKIYTQTVIQDEALPDGSSATGVASSVPTTISSPQTIKDNPVPKKRISTELLSTSLNTKSKKILGEFQFADSGAIKVGKYENGVSGEVKISPNGVVAKNDAGIETFVLDGTTGSAVFAGTIQTGTLISGEVIVGNNSVIIDGENKQIIINDGNTDRILIGFQVGGF